MSERTEASYVPGEWVAVAATHGWLLVDLPAHDPVVRRCWKLLSEDAAADAVLDALCAGGIGAAPGFALVTGGPASMRVVARHPARVTIHVADDDPIVASAFASVSWTDSIVDARVEAFTMTAPNPMAHPVELPMGTGVTTAATVTVTLAGTVTAPQRPEADAHTATVPERPSRDGRAFVKPELRVVDAPDAAPDPAPATIPPPPAAPPRPVPPPDPGPRPVTTGRKHADVDEPLPRYDHLFEATVNPPAPAPARAPRPERAEPASPAPTEHTAGWGTGPVPTPTASGLIQGVPWMSSDEPALTSATPVPPAATEPEPEPDEASTVDRSRIRVDAPAGPTVLAGRCTRGHLSAPYADRCRVCGVAMPTPQPFETPRPMLGMLRISTGDELTLDRGVLLGRSPELPSDHGEERPHVVRLRSPEKDISRNHAEIVLEGWNVYVRDLGSVNGTEVTLPGQPPVRLREHDLQLLEHGSTISLADEVTLTFEVTG